eukprot:437934_1
MCNYFQKHDLNVNNFAKILQFTTSKLYPDIDSEQIKNIAREANLTGQCFNRDSYEFKNSIKFGKIFASIANWNKKQWSKIYLQINKWQLSYKHLTPQKRYSAQMTLIKSSETMYVEETKITEEQINDYIIADTDKQLVDQFCAITHATKNTAAFFLREAEWNVTFAINKFYASSGNVSDTSMKKNRSVGSVYNIGIAFWYWEHPKPNTIYVQKRSHDLKQEMLQFKQFSIKQWGNLLDECNTLIITDKIRQMT